MRPTLFAAILLLLLPATSYAARTPSTISFGRSLIVASSSSGNSYNAGFSVITTAPVSGDLAVAAGSAVSAGSVTGDALLAGGTVSVRGPVGGDLRSLGGTVTSVGQVGGDLAEFGLSVDDSSHPGGTVFIVAAEATLKNGAAGPVTIYGNNVWLAGDFGSDVTIVATGRLALAASTTIRGTLKYEAPEPAFIPASVTLGGGVHYTSASYLPDVGTSRFLGLLGIGIFLFVRILGALILAGLFAGLFPRLAEMLMDRAFSRRVSSTLLTVLLGFGILVAAPVFIALLALTFVGIGIALLLFVLYALLVILGFLYAGIILGGAIARRLFHRTEILWRDGVVGMFVLSLVALLPIIGLVAGMVLMTYAVGALLETFFTFAFPREKTDSVY